MTIAIILGTRPEIIKMAPMIRECQRRGLDYSIIHTGQHYSYQMDRIFFEQLELPQHIGTETQRISDSSSPIPNSDEPFFFMGRSLAYEPTLFMILLTLVGSFMAMTGIILHSISKMMNECKLEIKQIRRASLVNRHNTGNKARDN